MFNPVRRNRNIGTAKQGKGADNLFDIPGSWHNALSFFEKLDSPLELKLHGWTILVESTREQSFHACTVEDILQVLSWLPPADLKGLNLIVLRQPKRKEELLNPVWGRLIYSFEYQKPQPAIILESVDLTKRFSKIKKMGPDAMLEFERLKEDGHRFEETNKLFVADFHLEFVRNTQLYRTLPHEVGHFVHYNMYIEANKEDDYFALPKQELEKFAHQYAQKWRKQWQDQALIPFPRKLDPAFMQQHALNWADFQPGE
ncbi:MAG: hypothetical protein J0M29_14875 [Chitinophagales bacterium]|nr:hypothetical protein [Chitinophagales bacterium]